MEFPRPSLGYQTGFGTGSDMDDVARNIGEDLEDALDEFQLDNDGMDKLDSDVEEGVSQGSRCPPGSAESDTEIYRECGEQEALVSDEEIPKKDVLDILSRLASQFSRTVEKLRRKAHVPSKASKSSALSVRSDPSSRRTPPLDSEVLVPCTQPDDDEEFEKDSVCS